MTRETAQKLLLNIDRIRDFAEGKEVQSLWVDKWVTLSDYAFDLPPEFYRIKPREPREFNACLNKFGDLVHESYGKNDTGYTPIRVREILPDETP